EDAVTPGVPAAIVAVGMSHFRTRRDDEDLVGLLQEGVELALGDAGLDMGDIDAVVLSQSPDALHGIGHPEQAAAAALATAGKPVLRVHTGGATGASAFQAGWWAVASGRFESVLVAGAEKMGDALQPAQVPLNMIWDPAYETGLPLNTIAMTALAAVRYMDRYGATEEDFAVVAERLRRNGAGNAHSHLRIPITAKEVMETPVLCWPLRLAMCCPQTSGGCAVVIQSAERARRLSAPAAWVRGVAARTNTYFMGDKMGDCGPNDHATPYELHLAATEAYAMAGIADPASEVHVAEPYVPFSSMEAAMLESLGLSPPGEGFRLAGEGVFDRDGRLPVCPSGGVMCTNPISVTALVRMAEAAQQVRRRAGDHQVDRADVAVATGVGGSIQFYVVGVFGREPRS
ncbi:MAG: thiolase C-terminal domain-containing protein, partial [Acidimicrobiia bacterium]